MSTFSRRFATFVVVPVLLASPMARSDQPAEQQPEAARDMGRIALSLLQYAEDFDQTLPTMTDTDAVARATKDYYAQEEDIFANSGTGQKYQPNTSLSKRELDGLKAGGIVLFYEPVASSDNKRWVLMLLPKTGGDYDYSKGGWVRQIDEKDWPKLKQVSGIN